MNVDTLVLGMGNYGRSIYEAHNAGYLALTNFINNNGLELEQDSKILFSQIRKSIYCLPKFYNINQTNLTLVYCYKKFNPKNIIIIFDDFDININELRISKFLSQSTHNGIRSLLKDDFIYKIKNEKLTNFLFFRIGIFSHNICSVCDYVLSEIQLSSKLLNKINYLLNVLSY